MLQFAGTGKNTGLLLVDNVNSGFLLVDTINSGFLLVDRRPFLLETAESDGAAYDKGEEHWLHHY